MTGLDLLAALRSVDARRPLLLSASMTPELAAAAKDFRVTADLQAPVAVETLVAAVRAAVAPAPPTPRAP
jgi:DNA-binding NarL/FixJ family response regulator